MLLSLVFENYLVFTNLMAKAYTYFKRLQVFKWTCIGHCYTFHISNCTIYRTCHLWNMPFSSYLVPLFQYQSSCKAFPMERSLIDMKMDL